MLTHDLLCQEMARSETLEEQTSRQLTLDLFHGLQRPLRALYDLASVAMQRFTAITSEALRANPRVIKILRYCLAPVISQMRLGQLVGVRSTDLFEREHEPKVPDATQATRLADWFQLYLDRERFPWTDTNPAQPALSELELRIAERYAKLSTVALLANQNTDTAYRNQRKQRQETAIGQALRDAGLVLQQRLGPPPAPRRPKGSPPVPRVRRPGGITALGDIQPGHYVLEKKILAGPGKKQKADLTARPPGDRLYCIEAKAVGIRLDSTKRLKELGDKGADWAKSGLPITTVGVCAGFFSELELVATIKAGKIPVFFEHDLARLTAFLRDGLYFGDPWQPDNLFPEVPEEQAREALEKIDRAESSEAETAEEEAKE